MRKCVYIWQTRESLIMGWMVTAIIIVVIIILIDVGSCGINSWEGGNVGLTRIWYLRNDMYTRIRLICFISFIIRIDIVSCLFIIMRQLMCNNNINIVLFYHYYYIEVDFHKSTNGIMLFKYKVGTCMHCSR